MPLVVIQLGLRPLCPVEHCWSDVFYDLAFFLAGYLLYADERFSYLTELGTVTLQKFNRDGFVAIRSFQLAGGKDVWDHLVNRKGTLMLSDHDTLHYYSIHR